MTRIRASGAGGRVRVTASGGPFAVRMLTPRPVQNGAGDDDLGAVSALPARPAQSARVALVGTQALLLAGDTVEIDLVVDPGVALDVVEVAATVAYGGSAPAHWRVRGEIAADSRLIWSAEPFIVAAGADVHRDSRFELADSAVLFLRETLVLGRSGESGGRLRSRSEITLAGAALLVEDLDLTEEHLRSRPGQLGGSRVLDSVLLAGRRAPAQPALPAGTRFELAGPGTLGRVLRGQTADSPVAGWAGRWRDAALAAHPGSRTRRVTGERCPAGSPPR